MGRHRYDHRLYALDRVLPGPGEPDRPALEQAMAGHVLETASLTGTYAKTVCKAWPPRRGREKRMDPGNEGARRLLTFYYLASPLFLLGHSLFGWSFRALFLETGGWLFAYYGFCFAIGLAARKWPGAGGLLGMLESSVNLLLLVLTVMLPVFRMADAIEDPAYVPPFADPAAIAGFLLVGTMLFVSFRVHERTLRQGMGDS